MAGGVSRPAISEDREGQGAIGVNESDATRPTASPGTAMQGVAHAGCGAFFSGAGAPLSSQPAIADAIGAAWALASQIGPNRTSSIIASTAKTAVRMMLLRGRDREFTPATGSLFERESTDQCVIESVAGAATIHSAIATIITFSVNDRKPSGTLLSPPTQAHFSSRLST